MVDRSTLRAAPLQAGFGAALLFAAMAALPTVALAQSAAPAPKPAAPAAAKPAAPKPGEAKPAPAAEGEAAGPAQLQPGQPNPWVKLCSKDGQNRDVCLIAQELRTDEGQVVGSVAVREIAGDPKKILLIAVPPLNLIQPGLRVGIDKGKLEEGKYTICFPNACYAEMAVTDAFIATMKKSTVLVVRTLNMQEKQQPYPFGLAGFKDAYEGPGLDPNAPPPGTGASANQQQLQQELEKRADEARAKLTNQPKP
ncbi:invasion associated locus B family protein [Prosthecodimorpha staleyi]|uniref:Invasion associated locus B family protein n=1 Tax=Prosthecodimorpha staleyi TaxID=2840188 RepID=A0A947GDA3_9HYPH|nr:invasion associated locus B family protein [Prosthecodimorpha staleyi]MBT9288065.1 invasion associated locus B family protein [Prosthecodimorpha staleyi]